MHCPGHGLRYPKFVVGPEVCGATRDLKFVDGHDVNARVRLEDVCLVGLRNLCAPVCADPVDLQGRLGCGALGARALGRLQTRGPFGQSESGSASLSTSRALDSELEALHGCT